MIRAVLLAIAGMAFLCFGLWLIYPPFMFLGIGLALLTLAFYMEVPEHETR